MTTVSIKLPLGLKSGLMAGDAVIAQVMSRMGKHAIRAEYGYPTQPPGQHIEDFKSRLMVIDEGNVCCAFSNPILLQEDGVAFLQVDATPSGTRGEMMMIVLDGKLEDGKFDLRGFPPMFPNTTGRQINAIVTWDFRGLKTHD